MRARASRCGLRYHRHVDDDPVALADAEALQNAGKLRDLVAQFAVGVLADGVGDRAVIDQRGLIGATALYVAVQGVVAGVDDATGEPPIEWLVGVIEYLVPLLVPMDRFRRFAPKALGVFDRSCNASSYRPVMVLAFFDSLRQARRRAPAPARAPVDAECGIILRLLQSRSASGSMLCAPDQTWSRTLIAGRASLRLLQPNNMSTSRTARADVQR